jgi:hypothetical protein
MSRVIGPVVFLGIGVFLIVARNLVSTWTSRSYTAFGLEKFMWPKKDQLHLFWIIAGIAIAAVGAYDLVNLMR